MACWPWFEEEEDGDGHACLLSAGRQGKGCCCHSVDRWLVSKNGTFICYECAVTDGSIPSPSRLAINHARYVQQLASLCKSCMIISQQLFIVHHHIPLPAQNVHLVFLLQGRKKKQSALNETAAAMVIIAQRDHSGWGPVTIWAD